CATTPDLLKTSHEVLLQTHVQKLRQELQLESEHKLQIPYSQFVNLAKHSGAAQTSDDCERLCQALHMSGVVLRCNNTVYLRVQEVCDLVSQLLPGGRGETQEKLAQVDAELAELDAVHAEVERRSHWLADGLLAAGFVVLVVQFFSFIWLTWWELSWDVMEPIAYIIQLFYQLVAFSYFMFMRHNFDLGPIRDFWAKRYKTKRIKQLNFDADRYALLKRLQQRYQRHLTN
ncbi:hypothetical protein QJQ45_022289, partial [Haematococcus lacustris]